MRETTRRCVETKATWTEGKKAWVKRCGLVCRRGGSGRPANEPLPKRGRCLTGWSARCKEGERAGSLRVSAVSLGLIQRSSRLRLSLVRSLPSLSFLRSPWLLRLLSGRLNFPLGPHRRHEKMDRLLRNESCVRHPRPSRCPAASDHLCRRREDVWLRKREHPSSLAAIHVLTLASSATLGEQPFPHNSLLHLRPSRFLQTLSITIVLSTVLTPYPVPPP